MNLILLIMSRTEKPTNMSVKDHLYRKVSRELNIPLSTVKVVLNNQFRTALSALKDNDSLEIAGFGKILFNVRRLRTEIKELEFLIGYHKDLLKKGNLDEKTIEEYEEILGRLPNTIKELNKRLKHYEENHDNGK